MFRTAELGQKVSKRDYKVRTTMLREALLEAQNTLRQEDFPVILLFGGVDGAGKGDVVNALNEWLDPRWIQTLAFDRPTQEELERPEYWRFWRALPPKGHIGLLLSAWYSKPLLKRAHGGSQTRFEMALEEITHFEKQLADDGALILKFWLHLGKKEQEKRFKKLEKDPLQAWRVTELDWEHWRIFDQFVAAAERIVGQTSTGEAPWHIVEGVDPRYASLRVGELLLEGLVRRLRETAEHAQMSPANPVSPLEPELAAALPSETIGPTVLSVLDISKQVDKTAYRKNLAVQQGKINQLQKRARDQKISTVVVFEGWDASGKGGAIRRINAALDSRAVRVIQTAAPTDEERAHHYLWRFWRQLSRAGDVTIFDRSWYGRVLVERVEGFATDTEWRRAYSEINLFEQQLVRHGIVLLKFWMHITQDEQLRRFKEREETPHKRWKLTDEDWRNRKRWEEYEIAVHDMVERTSTTIAPWVLVPANDKRFARLAVLEGICGALETAVAEGTQAGGEARKAS